MAWRCGASEAARDAARKPLAENLGEAAEPVAWANRRRASGNLADAPHRLRLPCLTGGSPTRSLWVNIKGLWYYRVLAAPATRLVDEGDVIDLGGRRFEILHLPGHSPGSMGLWEPSSGVLFSGDAVYDGPLLDNLPGSDVAQYIATMKRLKELPVTVVHGGHEESFGRERLVELADAYLEAKDA